MYGDTVTFVMFTCLHHKKYNYPVKFHVPKAVTEKMFSPFERNLLPTPFVSL